MSVNAHATGGVVTLFLYATQSQPSDPNGVYWDEAFLNGIPGQGGTWADFGSGTGAFTLALADLIGPQGSIYSVDKDRGSLREQRCACSFRLSAKGPSAFGAEDR